MHGTLGTPIGAVLSNGRAVRSPPALRFSLQASLEPVRGTSTSTKESLSPNANRSERKMRLVKLSLAASILVQTGIAAAAVEMTRPFEALEQSSRAMNELDKRQKREGVERERREKEQEVKRKSEEAGQRKRDRQEKAGQEAQRKRDAVAAKAAK